MQQKITSDTKLRVSTSLMYPVLSVSLGPTAVPNVQVTGKVLPGMVKTGQSPRNAESLSLSKVADITTTFKGTGRRLAVLSGLEKIFFNRPRRISYNKTRRLLNVSTTRLFV